MSNKSSNSIKLRKTKNDIYYTPLPVALKMIQMCNITKDMKVLDPSRGGGVFYNNLPECQKSYCEIEDGKDFFDWSEKVDLIIGNPPYSLWDKWLEHTMKLTDKFCYIFGHLNFTTPRLNRILEKGYGLTKIHIVTIEWWFGTSYIAVFEKSKESIVTVEPKRIYCDICNNARCRRGKDGYSPNECTIIKSVV